MRCEVAKFNLYKLRVDALIKATTWAFGNSYSF